MNCKYSVSNDCEMLEALKKVDETTIGHLFFTVEKRLCQTDKHETCDVYKMKILAEKK